MNTLNKVGTRTLGMVILVVLALAAAACTQQGLTGAMEEEELYNTNGLRGQPLFAPDGLAPVAVAIRPFIRVGLMWDAPDSTRLAGRVQLADGSWGDYQAIQPRFSEGGFHTGHLDVDSRARAFQLRLVAGQAPSFLLVEGIERVGESLDAEPMVQPDERFAAVRQALAPASLVHSRSDWGARSPKCNSGSHSPAKITIHHTASPLPDTVSVITRLRGIQTYHMDTRGWCDIGYHYLVDWNGEIWQGRPETTIGAHVLNNNTSNVGISFIGTYNTSSPTAAQINKAADLVDWLASTYGIAKDRSHLKGHREYRGNDPGDCPGDRLQARLGDLLGGGYVDDGSGDDAGDDGGASDPGNGTVQGVVFVDQGAGTNDMSWRLPGASVSTGAGSTSARADDAYWSMSLPGGTHTITASAAGYRSASRTCSVSANQSVWCSIGLVPDDGTAPGGDDGGGDVGGDDGSGDVGGDDGSGDAGGDDGGGGGAGDVGGDYGDNADEPPGRLFGFVVRADSEDLDLETCTGEFVAGAWVGAETQEFTYADGSGYFEFEVIAGDHLVGAKADGFLDGAANCEVEPGGETFCCVPLIPDPGVHPDEEEMTEVQVGCATAGDAGSAGWLALLALAALLIGQRRRTPGRRSA